MDEEISLDTYNLVYLPNGEIYTEDSQLCVQRKSDGTLRLLPLTKEVAQIFQIILQPAVSCATNRSETMCESTSSTLSVDKHSINEDLACDTESKSGQDTKKLKKWTRSATLELIHLRIAQDKLFNSTTIKNDRVWEKISTELKKSDIYCTPLQCRDRWKYLKQKYTEKRDNMGPRGTGTEPMHFEFFEEMDALLGKKHNVNPILASSIEGTSVSKDNNDMLENTQPPKKIKLRKPKEDVAEKLLHTFCAQSEKRDEERQRRHNELLAAHDRATSVFADKMDALISKIANK